jgi:hypothetical protein
VTEPASSRPSAAVDELRAAADRVAAEFPTAAALLRAFAAPTPDPRAIRRLVLRQLWRRHCPGAARTTAARLLAAAWRAWAPDDGTDLPDTLGAGFARLSRLGVAPLAWRQIADDLDAGLGSPTANFCNSRAAAARMGDSETNDRKEATL